MKISYECEEIIEELKEDIEEFGNIDMYAFFDMIDGVKILTDYTLIVEDMPLKTNEFGDTTEVQVMKAKDILAILEEQNNVL